MSWRILGGRAPARAWNHLAPSRLARYGHASVHAQFDRLLDYLSGKPPAVAQHLETARADILAFTGFPKDDGELMRNGSRLACPVDGWLPGEEPVGA